MKALMRNGRDRRSENPGWVTRGKNACECLGPISGSHQGQRPERPHSKAGYMTAPERFAQTVGFPLAPRAPSIHDPELPLSAAVLAMNGSPNYSYGYSAETCRRPKWPILRGKESNGDPSQRGPPLSLQQHLVRAFVLHWHPQRSS